jgi:hypothetical protein
MSDRGVPEVHTPSQTLEPDATAAETRAPSAEEWAAHVAAVRAARGRFAWVRTSSEEFSRRKQEDIEAENEQSRRRLG